MGADHPNMAASRASQIAHFKQLIVNTTSDPVDTRLMYEELGKDQPPFTKEERVDIGAAIAAKERAGLAANCGGSDDKQKHFFFYNYMSERLWTEQMDKNTSLQTKLNEMAVFAFTIVGLVSACEQTCRGITAITLAASGVSLAPIQAKAMIQTFTGYLKGLRANSRRQQATMQQFPEDVTDFLAAYPGRYKGDQPPVPPRVCTDSIKEMLRPAVMPCRRSATSLRSIDLTVGSQPREHAHAAFGAAAPMDQQMMMMVCANMMRFMMSGNQDQSSVPDMRLFFGQQGAPPGSEPPAGQQAITDRPPSPAGETLPGGNVVPPPKEPAADAEGQSDMKSKVHAVLQKKKAAAVKTKKAQANKKKRSKTSKDSCRGRGRGRRQ
jgi:hypothetical protein